MMIERTRNESDEERGALRLSRFSNFMSQHYRHFLAKRLPAFELGLSDYSIMLYLWHHLNALPSGASQTQLSENTLKDKASIARSVKRLHELGYITIATDPSNSSRNIIALTDAGAAVSEKIDGWVYEWEEQALSALSSDQREAFLRTFQQLFLDMRDPDGVAQH